MQPRRGRQPTAPPKLVEAVLRLWEEYPGRGKDRLVVLLRERGWSVSASSPLGPQGGLPRAPAVRQS